MLSFISVVCAQGARSSKIELKAGLGPAKESSLSWGWLQNMIKEARPSMWLGRVRQEMQRSKEQKQGIEDKS